MSVRDADAQLSSALPHVVMRYVYYLGAAERVRVYMRPSMDLEGKDQSLNLQGMAGE